MRLLTLFAFVGAVVAIGSACCCGANKGSYGPTTPADCSKHGGTFCGSCSPPCGQACSASFENDLALMQGDEETAGGKDAAVEIFDESLTETRTKAKGDGSTSAVANQRNSQQGKDCGDNCASCFPTSATVYSKRLGQKTSISKLEVGDSVLTHHGWAEVLFFAVHQPKAAGKHLKITTANSTLTLTGTHAVFNEDGSPVLARDVRQGDTLLSAGEVLEVEPVAAEGLIAPVTSTGTLVVDGVSTSDYGPFAHKHGQAFAHASLSPVRALKRLFPKWNIWNGHKKAKDGQHPFKTWGSWFLQL